LGDVQVFLDRRDRDVHDRDVEDGHEERGAHDREDQPAAVGGRAHVPPLVERYWRSNVARRGPIPQATSAASAPAGQGSAVTIPAQRRITPVRVSPLRCPRGKARWGPPGGQRSTREAGAAGFRRGTPLDAPKCAAVASDRPSPSGAMTRDVRPQRPAHAAQWLFLAGVALVAVLACAAAAVAGSGGSPSRCLPIASEPNYLNGLLQTLPLKRDTWGDQLLAAPGGPTYDAVRARLHPLFLVGRPAGLRPKRLTDSGVYYLAFGIPAGPSGTAHTQLHVADGSQVVSQVADGRRLTVSVGTNGKERYGSCLSRLATPALAEGYQPVLETAYTDAKGIRYQQESFAARIPQTKALVSFIALSVDPTSAPGHVARVRFTPSFRLRRVGHQLRHGHRTWAVYERGGRFDGHSLVFIVRRPTQVYVAWLNRGAQVRPFRLDRAAYEKAGPLSS